MPVQHQVRRRILLLLDPSCGGEVVALDVHEHKVKLIEDNAARLGVSSAVYAQRWMLEVSKQFEAEQFDRILVDAPCSGLGLLRRNQIFVIKTAG